MSSSKSKDTRPAKERLRHALNGIHKSHEINGCTYRESFVLMAIEALSDMLVERDKEERDD